MTIAWLDVLERGEAAVLVTRLSGPEARRVVFPSGTAIGTLGDAALDGTADGAARERLAGSSPASGVDVLHGVEIFLEVNQPPPQLVVFGAGQDAVPLVQQAWMLGFGVTVVDPRPAYLQSDLFAGARFDHATGLAGWKTTPIPEWVRVFKQKVAGITGGPPCPQ